MFTVSGKWTPSAARRIGEKSQENGTHMHGSAKVSNYASNAFIKSRSPLLNRLRSKVITMGSKCPWSRFRRVPKDLKDERLVTLFTK